MNIAEIKNDNERFRAYKNLGYTKEALKDEDWRIRLKAYETLGYTKEAMKDENWRIRFNAYKKLGFTKEALKDEDWNIRLNAYETLGYTKEAMKDKHRRVRFKAYENLGYTKEAMEDNCCEIRQKAYEYFKDHKQQQNIEKEMEYIPTFLQIENDSYRLVSINYKSSFKKGSINSIEYEKENGDLVVLTQEILKMIYKNKGE